LNHVTLILENKTMKRSIAFTGNNYSLLSSIVANRRLKGVKDTGNNINGHVNSILKEHFASIENQLTKMKLGEQIEVTRITLDTILVIKNQIQQRNGTEYQSLNVGDGTYIIKRTK